jgi:hypothetical protein
MKVEKKPIIENKVALSLKREIDKKNSLQIS